MRAVDLKHHSFSSSSINQILSEHDPFLISYAKTTIMKFWIDISHPSSAVIYSNLIDSKDCTSIAAILIASIKAEYSHSWAHY